jgi:H+/Cl- antiporter ClcA
MKTLISGAGTLEWLSGKVLICKIVGLLFGIGSGMFVGTLGPFAHMGPLIMSALLKLRIFRFAKKNAELFYRLVSVAGAIGVGTVLGCPIGGTLFGIEVNPTSMQTSSYFWIFSTVPFGTRIRTCSR